MRYRKLDDAGDYVFGHQQTDFWRDVPDAPAQAVWTRLALYEGDWYRDLTEGTPWRTKVLGKFTGDTRDAVIRDRSLKTQGITQVLQYSSSVDRDTRGFKVNITLDTIYSDESTMLALILPAV